ncbi:hypothetical protein ACFLUF_02835 [Chloroflexota bacterium]
MTKRGMSMLGYILIVTLVLGLLFSIVYPKLAKEYNSGIVALKAAAAKDIALTLETMYASPYDAKLQYDFDLSYFTVEISEKKVKIYDSSLGMAKDPTAAEYPFVPIGSGITKTLYKPEKIVFEKKEGILTVT